MDFREPFDFKKSPSMSSQLFKAAPGVFGGEDGVNPLQTINRVMVGGPLDIFDLIGRGAESAVRGGAELIGEGYEAMGGGQGMSERLKRDIYGLSQMAGLMAGSSPSALSSGARVPSTRAAAASDSTPSGIMMAIEGPPKPSGLLSAPKPKKALEGEIVSGPTDNYLKLQAQRDSASSDNMKSFYQEEMNKEALRDSFESIRRDIDEGFEDAAERGFAPMNADKFLEDLLDAVDDAMLKADAAGEKPNMGEIIAEVLPSEARSFENSYGLFVDYNKLTDKLASTADDVYGFGVKKAKNRREDARANRMSLNAQKREAVRRNEEIARDRMLGITDDMTEAQKQDIRVKYAIDQQNMASGMGLPPQQQGPNLKVVIDNDDIQKKNLASQKFKDEFEYDVYHGQRDPEYSIGVVKDPSGREILVEDATGEYGGINAFESSADKFPSHYPTDLGTFVSESRDVANYFAGDKGAVYPLKMRMRNPMRYETYEDLEDALSEVDDTSELTNRLIKEGYDGIEITYSDTDIPEIRRDFIPFQSNQLRSKYAKFDPEKRDLRNITYKNGGMVYNPYRMGIGAL